MKRLIPITIISTGIIAITLLSSAQAAEKQPKSSDKIPFCDIPEFKESDFKGCMVKHKSLDKDVNVKKSSELFVKSMDAIQKKRVEICNMRPTSKLITLNKIDQEEAFKATRDELESAEKQISDYVKQIDDFRNEVFPDDRVKKNKNASETLINEADESKGAAQEKNTLLEEVDKAWKMDDKAMADAKADKKKLAKCVVPYSLKKFDEESKAGNESIGEIKKMLKKLPAKE